MKRTVVLRGGPLDGHMREVEEGVRTAYVPYTTASKTELARLGIRTPETAGIVPVLVYKEVARGVPVWKYIGVNHVPVQKEPE